MNGKVEILIIEDSPTQAARLQYTLEQHNYQVILARNGVEALRIVAHHQPAVVISDIVMPEMDGSTLTDKIRETPALAPSRIVLLTSVGTQGENKRAREAGVDAYLTKPVHQAQFFECLGKVMGSAPGLVATRAVPHHATTDCPSTHANCHWSSWPKIIVSTRSCSRASWRKLAAARKSPGMASKPSPR